MKCDNCEHFSIERNSCDSEDVYCRKNHFHGNDIGTIERNGDIFENCEDFKVLPKTVVFEGFESGDSECFCFDVDWETYLRLKGENADLDGDLDKGTEPDTWRIYPSDLLTQRTDWSKTRKFKIKMVIEEVE